MLKNIVKLAILLYVLVNLILLFLIFDSIQLSDEKFLFKKSCPFCFGLSLCDELESESISNKKYDFVFANGYDVFYTYFLNGIFNIKNIYRIKDNIRNKHLILKKLAHDSEFLDFYSKEVNCEDGETSTKKNDGCLQTFIQSNKDTLIGQRVNSDFLRDHSDFLGIESTKCISQRILNIFYENMLDSKSSKLNANYFDENLNLFFSLKINPEPIFLQVYNFNISN
jgi:hypothetical protein